MKSKKDRLSEILKIREQMNNIGFSTTHPSINDFYNLLTDYLNDGKYYEFFEKKEIQVVLKYDKNV